MAEFTLRGTITAIVTPFKEDLSIDFDALKGLIDFQIDNGVDAIVVAGSTGESATLTPKEKMSLIIQAVDYSAGRVPIIAGTGSNNTQESIDLSLLAKEHGASAVLLVAPYYNKPSQEGLYNHYKAISEAVDLPQIIYNVPGRAGINIEADTQLQLAKDCDNILGTKEACGDLEQVMYIMNNAPEGFNLVSGDDALTLPIIMMGGSGVISVISNYAPRQFSDMVNAALEGNYGKAKKIHYQLLDLMQLNFMESNPIPVKAVLEMSGKIQKYLRLPLIHMADENKKVLEAALREADIIK